MHLLNILQTVLLTTTITTLIFFPTIKVSSFDYSQLNYVGSSYYYDRGKGIDSTLTELKTITKNSQIPLESFNPEVFNIDSNGALTTQSWVKSEYFSKFKLYASNIIPTVKGDKGYPNSGIASWHLLVKTIKSRSAAIDKIINYLNTNNLQGIEINFEPSSIDSPTVDGQKLVEADHQNYLQFLEDLGFYLKQNKKKLFIAVPPTMGYDNPKQLFNYTSLVDRPNLIKNLDKITIMAYDFNYGNSYFSSMPHILLDELLKRAQKDLGQYPQKVAIGFNSYGTCKNPETKKVTPLRGEEIKQLPGWGQFIWNNPNIMDGRDLTFWSNGSVCSYPSSYTQQLRIDKIHQYGFWQFAIWSLNGNDWVN